MAKFKVGIIGTGGIAEFHMAGYKAHPDVEVVALCDLDVEKAKRFGVRLGVPGARVYE